MVNFRNIQFFCILKFLNLIGGYFFVVNMIYFVVRLLYGIQVYQIMMGFKLFYLNIGVFIEVVDRILRIYQGGVFGRKFFFILGLVVKVLFLFKFGRDQELLIKVGIILVYLEFRVIKKLESKDDLVVGD